MNIRPALKALAAAFLAAIVAPGAAAQADFADIYSAGHADINIVYNATTQSFEINYEFASNAVINGSIIGVAGAGERPADSTTTRVGDNTLGVGPAALPSPFAGSPLWILPQVSQALKPFLGIGAEEVEPGLFQNDTLTLTLTGFAQRPAGGEFVLWQTGNEANPFINSANGLNASDSLSVGAGAHDHYNWGFTQAGTYDLVFTASGLLTNGTPISGSDVFRFSVGPQAIPEPGPIALALTAGLGLGAIRLASARLKSRRKAD